MWEKLDVVCCFLLQWADWKQKMVCLCTFTPFLAATLQTDLKIPKEVQFEGRFI